MFVSFVSGVVGRVSLLFIDRAGCLLRVLDVGQGTGCARGWSSGIFGPTVRAGGGRSYTIVWPDGGVHEEADGFLRLSEGTGTQKTYAYYLVDHLRSGKRFDELVVDWLCQSGKIIIVRLSGCTIHGEKGDVALLL